MYTHKYICSPSICIYIYGQISSTIHLINNSFGELRFYFSHCRRRVYNLIESQILEIIYEYIMYIHKYWYIYRSDDRHFDDKLPYVWCALHFVNRIMPKLN